MARFFFTDLTPNKIRELYSANEPSQEKVANVVLKTFEGEDLTPIQMAMINHLYCRISISCSKLRKENVLARLRLDHTKVTHSYLLQSEEQSNNVLIATHHSLYVISFWNVATLHK